VRRVGIDPVPSGIDERLDAPVAEHLDVRHPGACRAFGERVVAARMADQIARPDGNAAAGPVRIAQTARVICRHHHPVEDRIREAFLRGRAAVAFAQVNPAVNGRGGRDVSAGHRRMQRGSVERCQLAPRRAMHGLPSADAHARSLRQDAKDGTVRRAAHAQPHLRRVRNLSTAARQRPVQRVLRYLPVPRPVRGFLPLRKIAVVVVAGHQVHVQAVKRQLGASRKLHLVSHQCEAGAVGRLKRRIATAGRHLADRVGPIDAIGDQYAVRDAAQSGIEIERLACAAFRDVNAAVPHAPAADEIGARRFARSEEPVDVVFVGEFGGCTGVALRVAPEGEREGGLLEDGRRARRLMRGGVARHGGCAPQ